MTILDEAVPATRLDQSQTPYADAVESYGARDWVRLDVPGHQATADTHPRLVDFFGTRILDLDVPPLTGGIDQGIHPTPLGRSAELAAAAWGARKTYFLTNGASKGNLVTCLALRSLGARVLVQRSVHSSVMDGMALAGLDATFLEPQIDRDLGIAHGVTPESLRDALTENPDVVAAYVVTPSYFGAVADVAGLAEVAHAAGVALVVDEAWGAHFGFNSKLPVNAIRLGADVVISSTHKLGGSLTQSAMLHLGDGPFASALEPMVDRAFRSMSSTSTSALLLASLDIARAELATHGEERIGASIAAADAIRAGVRAGGRFSDATPALLASPDVVMIDPLRVVIDTRSGGISGHEAREMLFDRHQIHLEMSTDAVIVAVIGAGSVPDVERLLEALHSLPDLGHGGGAGVPLPAPGPRAMTVREAYFAASEVVPAEQAIGRVAADTLSAYPPGIPNLLAGEVVTTEVVEFLQASARAPYGHVRGGVSRDVSQLRVVVYPND